MVEYVEKLAAFRKAISDLSNSSFEDGLTYYDMSVELSIAAEIVANSHRFKTSLVR